MLILSVVFFAGTFGLNFQMTSALMATQVFHKGATEYGLLGSAMAVGSLTGALMAARRTRIRLRLVVGAALAFGVVEIARRADADVRAYVADRAAARLHRADMITAANTTMQLATAPGLRGRVMALYLMVLHGRYADRVAVHRLDRRAVRRTLDADRRWWAHHPRRARRRSAVFTRGRGLLERRVVVREAPDEEPVGSLA